MCGIAGLIGISELVTARLLLDKIHKRLAHRGPDDFGIEIINMDRNATRSLSLVHCRLSVIDLSPMGHQPMYDLETGNWIVYNGEIYNFTTLRAQLEGYGHTFSSTSDTEVILKAYAQWGKNCTAELRGMFAFAIWDQLAQCLFLAVDRLGIKPIYYFLGKDGLFIFSSELRALLASELMPRIIDPDGLESFLAFGAVQAPNTIIQSIKCLRPGQYLVVNQGGEIVQRDHYWFPNFVPKDCASNRSESEIVRDLRLQLEDSVQAHLVSDVPIGLFLSGGIDSSSLVALVNEIRSEPPLTFSITFSETEFSEAPFSRLIAQKYRTDHYEICLKEEQFLGTLSSALAAMDQPSIDGTNVFVISEAVRKEGLKVILSGQGGDEILTGYSTYRFVNTFMRYRPLLDMVPYSYRQRMATLWRRGSRHTPIGHKLSDLILVEDDTALQAYLILRTLFLKTARRQLHNSTSNNLYEGLPGEIACYLRKLGGSLDVTNQVSLYELTLYLANMLLRDGDAMGMAHGVEIRVPFLDHKLVDFVGGIPGHFKLDSKLPKPLLIKAMGTLLPPEIYQRPKAGFTFPWEYWMRNQLCTQIGRTLSDRTLGDSIGIEAEFCLNLWKSFLRHQPGVSWSRIWGLFVIYNWCARHHVHCCGDFQA